MFFFAFFAGWCWHVCDFLSFYLQFAFSCLGWMWFKNIYIFMYCVVCLITKSNTKFQFFSLFSLYLFYWLPKNGKLYVFFALLLVFFVPLLFEFWIILQVFFVFVFTMKNGEKKLGNIFIFPSKVCLCFILEFQKWYWVFLLYIYSTMFC